MRTLFTGITEDIEKLRQHYGQDVVCTPLIENPTTSTVLKKHVSS